MTTKHDIKVRKWRAKSRGSLEAILAVDANTIFVPCVIHQNLMLRASPAESILLGIPVGTPTPGPSNLVDWGGTSVTADVTTPSIVANKELQYGLVVFLS